MTLAVIVFLAGLALLIWSAGYFVEGSAATARHLGIPPLLIGMVIVGFGTSAPEMVVSAFAASMGNPGIALGNAYGSNIMNIALILGLTAVISPIAVHSQVMRKELPILTAVTALAAYQLLDGEITRADALVLSGVFVLLMGWSVWEGLRQKGDPWEDQTEHKLQCHRIPLRMALVRLVVGLVFLIASSRMLVWGAVAVAGGLGVSDLIIGLTIVAVGTSLPELASSLIAARKGEHDIAVGNVIGSNLFNTLAVVAIAGVIRPMEVAPEVFYRDVMVMSGLTVSLFILGYGFRKPGRISRFDGALLLTAYIGYTTLLLANTLGW